MKLILVILLIPLQVNAYSYYYFNRKQTKINPASFKRYVIPQTRSIIKEYYSVLTKIDPFEEHLIDIRKKVASLVSLWKENKNKCVNIDEFCLGKISQIYKEAKKLDRLIVDIESNKIKFDKDQFKDIDAYLSLTSKMNEISHINFLLVHYIEEMLMVATSSYSKYLTSPKTFEKYLHKMDLTSQLMINSKLDPELREEFDTLYKQYIKMLDFHILTNKDSKALVLHLEDLNMAWNNFHMKTVKGKLNLNKNTTKVINIMHNRWNSILKIILRK